MRKGKIPNNLIFKFNRDQLKHVTVKIMNERMSDNNMNGKITPTFNEKL